MNKQEKRNKNATLVLNSTKSVDGVQICSLEVCRIQIINIVNTLDGAEYPQYINVYTGLYCSHQHEYQGDVVLVISFNIYGNQESREQVQKKCREICCVETCQ